MKFIIRNKIKNSFAVLFVIACIAGNAQDKTAASLYYKKDKQIYLNAVESKSGNLFTKLGHHGPAVENKWLALRLYFNKKTAIDVYSKAKPGLELRSKKWYPNKKEQLSGWGADYYKVGKTVGLGGIKLWDGEKVVSLHPVTKRWARVETSENSSTMKLVSEGIDYKGKKINIEIQVSVFNDKREAKVEAQCTSGQEVQFVTGINYFDNLQTKKTDGFIATWGIHPEDVAAEKIEVGAAIIFKPEEFQKQINDGKQYLLISYPTTKIQTLISSANAREEKINTFKQFLKLVESITIE